MKDALRDENGAVIVIAVVLLSVSLLLLAMVIDLGTVWLVKAKVQTALDAATLAATSGARVQVQKSYSPNFKTERFESSSQFPPAELIVGAPVPQWDTEYRGSWITYETPEGKGQTEYFPWWKSWPDNIIDEEEDYEDVLLGYDVTYVESFDEHLESYTIWLDEIEASCEAGEVMDINLLAERRGGVAVRLLMAMKMPGDNDSVGYRMEVEVEVPSRLLAPIMRLVSGMEGPRLFRFRVSSESKAYLQ